MYKLSHRVGDSWVEHSHQPAFARQAAQLVVAVPGGDKSVMQELLTCAEPSFYLLCVLNTPRGEAAAGRYQSPLLEQQEFDRLLDRDISPQTGGLICGFIRRPLTPRSSGTGTISCSPPVR